MELMTQGSTRDRRPVGYGGPGGLAEVLRLGWPLILANSLWTAQVTIDRVLLGWYDERTVGAQMAAAWFFWVPFSLLYCTANYISTFVAQYRGAGRESRVWNAACQGVLFSLATGLGFLVWWPVAPAVFALGGHTPTLMAAETLYFRCLCFAALPMLLSASACAFFAGLGRTWVVLWIHLVGLASNALLDWLWIYGRWGFPAGGLAGAGWATVAATWVSALVGLAWMYAAGRAWGSVPKLPTWDWDLMRRLWRYGFPTGLQWALDTLAFTVFLFLLGRRGELEMSAASIAFTLNMVVFMPPTGIGQAVSVLVGQYLGAERVPCARRATWNGFWVCWAYMSAVAAVLVLWPERFTALFVNAERADGAAVTLLTAHLLHYVAVYSLFDSANVVFAAALKGAGDTRFVALVQVLLAWALMVVPTWLVWSHADGMDWAWTFAAGYVIVLALVFWARFQSGVWEKMRVIESVPTEDADRRSFHVHAAAGDAPRSEH